MAVVEEERAAQQAKNGFPPARPRIAPSTWDADVVFVRDRVRRGLAEEAQETIERLMERVGGVTPVEVGLAYAEYLLGRGRPFAAGRALWPLVQREGGDPRARVLYAEALAGAGNLDKALALVEQTANAGGAGAVEAAAAFDGLYRLKSAEGDAATVQPRRAELARLTGRELEALLAAGSPAQLDRWIDQRLEVGQEAGTAEAWGLYLGSFLVQHARAEWRWRRRLMDSTVVLPLPGGSLELAPCLWGGWRLQGQGRRLGRLVSGVLEMAGLERSAIRGISGDRGGLGGSEAEPDAPPDDVLVQALDEGLRRSRLGQSVEALGIAADTPVANFRIPLLVSSGDEARGPLVVLFRDRESTVERFARTLDLLCLSRFVGSRWSLGGAAGIPGEEGALYESGDPAVRACLVARRLCGEEPAANARWAVTVAQVALNRPLDGTPGSLHEVDRLIWDDLRPGGRVRWGALFEDRFALLLLLTCYAGEVLRVHYGGRWGGDRLTGRPLGPTSGLELAGLRFNLGAKVLTSFYLGPERPFAPSAVDFARRTEGGLAMASLG